MLISVELLANALQKLALAWMSSTEQSFGSDRGTSPPRWVGVFGTLLGPERTRVAWKGMTVVISVPGPIWSTYREFVQRDLAGATWWVGLRVVV